MTAEKRLFRAFSIFALLAGLCLAILYCVSAGQNYLEREEDWLSRAASVSSDRFADVIEQSEAAVVIFLSDPDTLQAVQFLAKGGTGNTDYESLYFSQAYSKIRARFGSFYVFQQFDRLIFFNQRGNIIAESNSPGGLVDADVHWVDIPGIEDLPEGGTMILPCHADLWGSTHDRQVLSVIRRLVGQDMGYIEVQWSKDSLDELFRQGADDVRIYAGDGTPLYTVREGPLEDSYYELAQQTGRDSGTLRTSNAMVAFDWDRETDTIILVMERVSVYQKMMGQIIPYLFLLLAGFFTFAFLYAHFTSRHLTDPIAILCRTMEHTELNCLLPVTPEEEKVLQAVVEFDTLYQSFRHMLDRLSVSTEREKQLSLLNLQVSFDLLQAQVNPHFLYNVLNVISAKGIMNSDESICDICSCLGEMLRYSTDTTEKTGTVAQEESYLGMYLNLLHYRYEHRLEYSIRIAKEIQSEALPKIVLQQIVENSVTHGYTGKCGQIHVTVIGEGKPGNWQVTVSDDGCGFNEEKKREIEEKMRDMRRRLSDKRERVEMAIGGMGLINTYARLYLIYGEQLSFTMSSGENGTAVCIRIGEEEAWNEPI